MDKYSNFIFLISVLILVLFICRRRKNNIKNKLDDINNREINKHIKLEKNHKITNFNNIDNIKDKNDNTIDFGKNNSFNKKVDKVNNFNKFDKKMINNIINNHIGDKKNDRVVENKELLDINENVIESRDKDIKILSDKKLKLSSKFLKKDYILNNYIDNKEKEVDNFDYTIKHDPNNLLERPKLSVEYDKPITSEVLNSFDGMKIKDIYDSLTKNDDINNVDVTSRGISAKFIYSNCVNPNSEY